MRYTYATSERIKSTRSSEYVKQFHVLLGYAYSISEDLKRAVACHKNLGLRHDIKIENLSFQRSQENKTRIWKQRRCQHGREETKSVEVEIYVNSCV